MVDRIDPAHRFLATLFFDDVRDEVRGVEAVDLLPTVGDNALQPFSVATVHELIREFPPLNDYSSR